MPALHDKSDGEGSSISPYGMKNGSDSALIRRSTPPPDLFEFFSDGAAPPPELCAADDIFVRGRMLPSIPTLAAEAEAPPQALRRSHSQVAAGRGDRRHRRSESVDGIDRRRQVNYCRLRRAVSDSAPAGRAPRPKPRWYWFLFGSVRVPETAMEMSEIRSRLRRRGSAPPAAEPESSRWAPWKLIQSLSCKGVECAAPAAPAPIVSHGVMI